MLNDKSFILQVVLLTALTFVGGLWIFYGAAVPVVATTPLKPSIEVPTVKETLEKSLDGEPADKEASVEQARLKSFFEYGNDVVLRSTTYRNTECHGNRRPALIASINRFDSYRRLYPNVGLTGGGQLIRNSVETSVNALFVSSLLTLQEFPARTRSWLQTFVHPGSKEDAQAVKKCQERGWGTR